MGLIDYFENRKIQKAAAHRAAVERSFIVQEPQAHSGYRPYQQLPVYEVYNGEKSYGELGAPIMYSADFRSLAIRSWQSYYESDITQMIMKNYLLWVIGRGLELNSEPIDKYIKKFDPTFNRDTFTDDVEDLWYIFAGSTKASYSEMQDLHQLAHKAQHNACIGGDVLVIMRYDGTYPSIQLIDGLHIMNPSESTYYDEAKARGNRIKTGVEIDPKGKHVAFYVRGEDNKTERVAAFHSKTKRPLAWLVYGHVYRIDDVRGMPLFGVVLEDLKKLGRYKEATVSSAEENAKVVFSIEHDKDSNGGSPFTQAIKQAASAGQPFVPETQANAGDVVATRLAMTTNNQAVNLEPGATLKSHKSEAGINFKDFFTTNFELICATFGVAPEVVLNKYDSNYSASRMATKMTEFKYVTDRANFAKAFYKPIYSFWLDTRVLLGKVTASGYLTAMINGDYEMLQAFKNSEFIGPNMPHVDPLKEVMAERRKLGDDLIPLTTRTKAASRLGEGDWYQNIDNFKQENEKAGDLIPPKTIPNGGATGNQG